MVDEKKTPPVVRLKYAEGELIIKEGDYGVSIYKVVEGRVLVFKKSGNDQTDLAVLGKGEVFGEMTFFNFLMEPRTASVKALDDVQLEVWHSARLIEEYRDMPPMLRYICQQTLKRLLRMTKILEELTIKKKMSDTEQADPIVLKRKYYRKPWDQVCTYRPLSFLKMELPGCIRDISPMGLGVEIPASNSFTYNHRPGSEVGVTFQLPSGATVDARAEIRSLNQRQIPGHLFLGLEFIDIGSDEKKQITFFMMP